MVLHSFSHSRSHPYQFAQWSVAIAVIFTILLTVWLGRYQQQQMQPLPDWVPIAQGGTWESLVQ
ncbi:MAG: hypothetical protein VKJ09_06705 [Leptolyngbya sp.]|nr:hypothetical protein [Leptolyngbya sp.]